jgi:hypothetical protein
MMQSSPHKSLKMERWVDGDFTSKSLCREPIDAGYLSPGFDIRPRFLMAPSRR